MSDPAIKLATYADLFDLPDGVRGEVLGGQIITSPAPLPKHSKAQGAMRGFVGKPYDDDDGFGGPGGWWIFIEVDVELDAHNVLRPDLAGWRRERLPNPGEERPICVAPDWVCEVLSPSTAQRDRVTKSDLYAAAGVGHYWIVDVNARTLEAFELIGERWTRIGAYDDSHTARVAPFEAVDLAVGRLFLPKPPDSSADQ